MISLSDAEMNISNSAKIIYHSSLNENDIKNLITNTKTQNSFSKSSLDEIEKNFIQFQNKLK